MTKNWRENIQVSLVLLGACGVGFGVVFYVQPALEHLMENSEWMQQMEARSQQEKQQRLQAKITSQRRADWDRVQGLEFIPYRSGRFCFAVSQPDNTVVGPVQCDQLPPAVQMRQRP